MDKASDGRSFLFLSLNITADHHHPPPKFAFPVAVPSQLSTPAAPP
jgi:hypothetical protein